MDEIISILLLPRQVIISLYHSPLSSGSAEEPSLRRGGQQLYALSLQVVPEYHPWRSAHQSDHGRLLTQLNRAGRMAKQRPCRIKFQGTAVDLPLPALRYTRATSGTARTSAHGKAG